MLLDLSLCSARTASPRRSRPPPSGSSLAAYPYYQQYTPRSTVHSRSPSPRVASLTPRGTPREGRSRASYDHHPDAAAAAGYGMLPRRYLQRTSSTASVSYYYQQQSPRGAPNFTPRAYQQASPRGGGMANYPPPSPRGYQHW